MDCREFRETFSDYLDGWLDEAAEVRARAHLEACASCRRFDRAYHTGVETLRGLPALGTSRDFCARLLHRVRRERTPPALVRAYGLGGALLAVSFAAVLVLDLATSHDDGTPVQPSLAETPALAEFAVDSGADLITVHVIRGELDLPLPDPFSSLPSMGSFEVSRVRFEVPAVWAGR